VPFSDIYFFSTKRQKLMLLYATSNQYNTCEVLTSVINQLAARLRLLRRENRLTQSNLARAILVPRVTYTHYELGKRTPDLDTIIMLARYFLVSVDYLVGNSDVRAVAVQASTSPGDMHGDYTWAEDLNGQRVADWPDETSQYD
jgi:transcriptional regulator with XRE-family HTH domain